MSAYRDRAAVVIGGFGFIGGHLTRELARQGARVTAVTPSLTGHRGEAETYAQAGVGMLEGDLRDADAMRRAVSNQDVVFNVAGRSGAGQSIEDPWTDLDVNCRGNLVLLEALRTHAPSATLVFASSRLAYGSATGAGSHGASAVSEDHPVDPTSMHGAHKLAVEQYLRIYAKLYGLKSVVARLTNPYGPGQPRERTAYGVVNRLIHLALAGEALPVYGDGRQLRDYVYVDDVVRALLALGSSSACVGRVYNVGSGSGTALAEMARTIVTIVGRGRVTFVPWPALAAQIETGDFVADVAKIRRDTGWTPDVNIVNGLEQTVAFYRAHIA